jgi:sodium pump decarboxylase gamma subunit
MGLEKLFDALRLSAISMGIVFAVLYLLSVSFELVSRLVGATQKGTELSEPRVQPEVSAAAAVTGLSPQMVAVIAAAAAAYLGRSMERLNVISIRRAPTSVWSLTAQRESVEN